MFIKTTVLFSFILVTSSQASTDEVPTFPCDQGPNIQWMCSLEKVKLTKDNSKFKPTAKDANLVTSVYITDSYIPILGEDICTEFPNAQHIWLYNIGLEKVETTALRKCKNLVRVFMNKNPLKQLASDTFRYNTNLELIDLSHNQIREINNNVFYYNTKLQYLSLYDNLLREFSWDTVKRCPKLTSINVAANDLTDLNEVTLIDNLSDLKDISYSDNELNCARVVEINRAFNDVKVTVRVVEGGKKRFYTTLEVDGIKCLTDDIWILAQQRKTLTKK